MLSEKEIVEIKDVCKKMRRNIVSMVHAAKSGHPGGSLSCVEILATLYTKCMNYKKKADKDYALRDRFVMSKGHASPALYAILSHCGFIPENELSSFRCLGSKLQGHPCCKYLDGVEVSTGSLGQGLSIACGMALGLRLDKIDSKVFVLMGDGEIQEGSVWEAVMNANHYNLSNIIAFVDRNGLQIDGPTEKVMSLGDVKEKFKAFGWNTIEIDGHNVSEVYEAIQKAKQNTDKPTVIVANTVKGKGVSFMENNAGWHGKAPSDEELKAALMELGV